MDSKDRPFTSVPVVPQRASSLHTALALDLPAPKAEAASASVNILRAGLRSVRRHWWQILGLWVLATGSIWYVISTQVKPIFESASVLRVDPGQGDLFNSGSRAEAFEPFLETQVQILTSPNVLSAALVESKSASMPLLPDSKDPEGDLRKRLQVSIVPRTHLIRVAMQSPIGPDATAAVTAVTKAYLASAEEYSDLATRNQIKSLEAFQRELQNQADEKQAALIALAEKGNLDIQMPELAADPKGAGNLPTAKRSQVTIEEYKRVRDFLFKVNIDLAEAEAVLAMREEEARTLSQAQAEARPEEPARDRSAAYLERAFRADPEAAAILKQIASRTRAYNEATRLSRNPNDPSVKRAREDLEKLNREYRALFDSKRETLLAQPDTINAKSPDGMLLEAREAVRKLKASKVSYEDIIKRLEVINRQEGSDTVRAAFLREEYSGLRDMLQQIVRRLEDLKYASRGQARITMLSAAQLPVAPSSDNRLKYMAMTPGGVLAVLLAMFVLLELKIGRVSDLDDLSKHLPVEVFAIPPLPGPRLEPGQKGAREREARLQEFLQTLDHLRVALCGEEATGAGRCLMITSATAGEGKTTLSAQLAACCAKAGLSTLLVDADLRRATLSRILNEEATPGLSDVLQGELEPDEAPVALPDAGFHFLAAGSPGRDPSWLLKNQRIGQLLTRYRQSFDIIVIDTPPVLPVPDALTIGRWADGAVLTTRFDVSRFPLVDRARKRITSAGVPLLKTVVNGVKTSRFAYGYGGSGYGYGYGGGYGGYGGYGDRATEAPAQTPVQTETA